MKKIDVDKWIPQFALIILILTGCIGGGFFIIVSAVLNMLLLIFTVLYIYQKRKVKVPADINMLAVIVVTVLYYVTTLWAVDSGMALMGGIKFTPVILYFFLICQMQDRKEKIIRFLPICATLMTLFSFIMMQFSAFEKTVTVAGRLAGFFQYPNTYALFLLISIIISVYRINPKHIDWLDGVNILSALFGIFMSGSRTVFVMTLMVILFLVIQNKEVRKIAVGCILVLAVIAVISVVCGIGSRFTTISFYSSTLLGRLLYAKDSIALIIKHPFGLGYYGYYFMQQQVQSGVYSVVNVHNEFLQIMLDIGIIPAILFYGAIVKSIISKNNKGRNRLILIVLLLHSLADYDFQFMAVCFILILFLDVTHIKEVSVPKLTKAAHILTAATVIILSIRIGASEILYMSDKCGKSLNAYSGNTRAKIALLIKESDTKEIEKTADSILESNKNAAIAYSAKSRADLGQGNVEEFVKNKLRAIQLAPYQFEEYVEYLEALNYCFNKFYESGDVKSAEFCLERAAAIPDMLKQVKDRTSWLGWHIKDSPKVVLSHEDLELIEEMRVRMSE